MTPDPLEQLVADVLTDRLGDQPTTVTAALDDGRRITRHAPDPATAVERLADATRSTP